MSEPGGTMPRGAGRVRAAFELPELLAEIADVAGLSAALAVAQLRGGTRTHFPAKAADDHWLVGACGREAADKICEHFTVNHRGGLAVVVPLGPTRLYDRARFRARELIAAGRSISETAREVGVSTRAVEIWNARHLAWLAARAEARDKRRAPAVVLDREHEPVVDGLMRRLRPPGASDDIEAEAEPGRNAPGPPDFILSECPPLLAEIARVAGLGTMVVLGSLRRGRVVHVTDHAGHADELATLVGSESAGRIARHFAAKHGGEIELLLPVLPPGVAHAVFDWIAAMQDRGHATSDLADWLGVTPAVVEHMRGFAQRTERGRPFHRGFPHVHGSSEREGLARSDWEA